MKKFGALSSSADPAKLSLTVESITKVILGAVAIFAVSKGMDITTATTQAQAILDLVMQSVTIGFTLYHSILTVYGLMRKGLIAISASVASGNTSDIV